MKNKKIFLALGTAVLLLACLPTYELFFKDKMDSVEVLVVNAEEGIKAKDQLTEDNVIVERRRKQDLVAGTALANDFKEVIGKEAGKNLVNNSIVSKEDIDFEDLVPDRSKGEAIRPIVNDMIFAQPGSLRRKDSIDIYAISDTDIETNTENETQEANNNSGDAEEKTIVSSTNPEQEVAATKLKAPILQDVKVVYVKDSSNQEVTNEIEEKGTEERLNATGNISDLEVILDEADFDLLMNTVLSGKKLYITYN
ncbi:SAF domain-containing protein [Terribacillus saccharophilus]|uniref:SAF domain-containing protein n=1 Tax=Terribacillus saccharophilus TaxID=361277 RepID=UPI00380A0D5A